MVKKILKKVFSKISSAAMIFIIAIIFFHIILSSKWGWYQSQIHTYKIAFENAEMNGYINDSLYLCLKDKEDADSLILKLYVNAYNGTINLMRAIYPSLYRHNDILQGISYKRKGDDIIFRMTDGFAGRNSIYVTTVNESGIIRLQRLSDFDEQDILVEINRIR